MTEENGGTAAAQPNVADFGDYRDYLKAVFEARKSPTHRISYECLARRSKLSKTHVHDILRKKVHASLEGLAALCRALKVEASDREVLILNLLALTSTDEDIRGFFKHAYQMLRGTTRYRLSNGETTTMDPAPEASNRFPNLLPFLALEMSNLKGYQPNVDWMSKRIRTPELRRPQELSGALEHIRQRKLLPEGPRVEPIPPMSCSTSGGLSMCQEVAHVMNQALSKSHANQDELRWMTGWRIAAHSAKALDQIKNICVKALLSCRDLEAPPGQGEEVHLLSINIVTLAQAEELPASRVDRRGHEP